ncbi:hypothetical protein E2C01_030302 [Portunus trituberculatus]|uniref:Uncharacterized protein n=1 Tax=Portunus trituberculatus TaxID=210409 RepID=A0A5B7ETW2_PORTR|nr:hypothetical protein [Portunus trituberculatus]
MCRPPCNDWEGLTSGEDHSAAAAASHVGSGIGRLCATTHSDSTLTEAAGTAGRSEHIHGGGCVSGKTGGENHRHCSCPPPPCHRPRDSSHLW